MRVLFAVVFTVIALAPSFALAFPFGGQIGIVKPCYNNAIYVALGPPRGGPYIWTPSTRTYLFGPPSHVGQWLLGLASAPYYCVVSIFPVIVWPGTHIDMMGSSGSPAPIRYPGTPSVDPTPPPMVPSVPGPDVPVCTKADGTPNPDLPPGAVRGVDCVIVIVG
jgi:hypothetical protein